jgi:serine/threonine protein phosphatase 1
MMLDAIKSRGKSQKSGDWALNGGLDTVKSYVGSIYIDRFLEEITGVYRDHLDALRNAALWKSIGPFLVVHAGYLPGTPIESQGADTLCWIRHPFLDNVDADALLCVHGHTIVGELPVITENRISLDTGSHQTGKLTTMVYDPTSTAISFFQTHPRAGIRYIEPKLVDRGFGTILDRSDLFDRPHLAERSEVSTPTSDALKPR